MFEININNNSPRISLARAAQLTGYHQDYLGQLCRLGKLPATKVGRNWFTSADALNNLSSNLGQSQEFYEEAVGDVEEPIQETEQLPEPISVSQPIISQNITVSEVEGMPIAIQTLPVAVRNTNTVQNILTNMRIESLQQEVTELRQLLFKLMQEVKAHAGILESREIMNRVQDSLKHSYVSNFDFNMPEQRSAVAFETPTRPIWEPEPARRYELVSWLAASAAVVAITFIGVGAISGNFFGTQSEVKTVYYHSEIVPEVAGVETPNESEILPTDSAGELIPNVVQ